MSFGAQYQHRGVEKVERLSGQDGAKGLTGAQLARLFSRPSWVVGTIMLGLAIVCQLGALSVAPLIVVQPLGAISLVITTLLNARISGHSPTRKSVTAIVACVGGIFIFVLIAAIFASERDVTERDLLVILALLGGAKGEVPFDPILRRRLTITGGTLRPRPVAFKGEVARDLKARIWPLLESGRIKPVIHATFALEEAGKAHALMESGAHIGKIVLTVG